MSLPAQQCPQCQKIIDVNARFCSDCGTRLSQSAQINTPLTPSVSSPSNGPAWQKHKDIWNGFSLEHPSGWEVHVTRDAISVCQDKAGLTKVVIHPLELQQSMSAYELAREVVKGKHAINKTFTAWKMNAEDITYHEMQQGASTDQVLLRIRSMEELAAPMSAVNNADVLNVARPEHKEIELIGVLSVMVNGNSAIVSGFQAPPPMIEKLKPLFQHILASFQAETRLARIEYVEPGKRAFTASIPPGWQAAGSIVSTPTGELMRFQASDPEGKMSAEAPARSHSFLEETQNEWEKKARAATPNSPTTLSYLPAPAFVEQILVPEMQRRYADFQVESIVNQIDQANFLVSELIQQGQPVPSKRPSFASLQGTFTQNGVTYRQKTFVGVLAPTLTGPVWSAFISCNVRTPLELFAQYSMILEGIITSIRPGKEWIQEQEMRRQQQQQVFEQYMHQQQMSMQQQMAVNQQAFREGQMRRHEMFMNAQQQRFEAQQASVRRQQNASHRHAQAFIHNVIQGYQYVQNPYSGVKYDVPIGYNNYWANSFGDVVVASDSPYSPGYDFQLLNPLEG